MRHLGKTVENLKIGAKTLNSIKKKNIKTNQQPKSPLARGS
jgi:hypothetical protein